MNNKKLLIIGNGFDLKCGLKSSFSDYLNHKNQNAYKEIIKISNKLKIDYPIYYLNVKDFWQSVKFSNNLSTLEKLIIIGTSNIKDIPWFDVERFLYNLLEGEHNFDKVCELIYEYDKSRTIRLSPSERLTKFKIKNIIDLIAATYYFDKESDILDNHIQLDDNYKEILYKELNNDLRRFENDFMEYLKNEKRNNKEYYNNANNLFEIIGRNENTEIMTFNYTQVNDSHKYTEMVHGSLETNSIIIGIDSTSIKHFKPSYKFTKTYRKVEKYFLQSDKIVYDVISKDYDEIIFYGHSLNEQDYAYFQTIFDKQDLYNSNVKLTFKYSIYDKDKKELIIENNISSIIALIESYGETLDNKHKGKNLLHKLLNESRIKVFEI